MIPRPRRKKDEPIGEYRDRVSAYVAQYLRGQRPPQAIQAAVPVAAPAPGVTRSVSFRGRTVQLAEADALALFGALAVAVDGQTSRITLASGDVLDLTHQEVSDLGRQLAGMPADEVSGPDR